MSRTVTTTAEELANVQALLERRSTPVKYSPPHMPGVAATETMKTTGSLKGTMGLMVEKRPVGEQDFYAEESELFKYDFGRHQGDYFQ